MTFHSHKDVQITTYADDITITTSQTKHRKAQQFIQLYLYKIYEWATTHDFHITIAKLQLHFFTAKYGKTL